MNMQASGSAPSDGQGLSTPQVAALCWRMHKGVVQVVLITSRETGRWVIPKGWPMAGLTPSAAAAREAWEEAGVIGRICDKALGEFLYDKVNSPVLATRCNVAVFALRVEALKRRFPEAGERLRRWFAAEQAAELVAEPDLARLLQSVAVRPALLKGQKPSSAA